MHTYTHYDVHAQYVSGTLLECLNFYLHIADTALALPTISLMWSNASACVCIMNQNLGIWRHYMHLSFQCRLFGKLSDSVHACQGYIYIYIYIYQGCSQDFQEGFLYSHVQSVRAKFCGHAHFMTMPSN